MIVNIRNGWNPKRPFERNSPNVEEAIRQVEKGNLITASTILEDDLGTGPCKKGTLDLSKEVRERGDASFDLGIVLFRIAETFGKPFGEEEISMEEQSQDPKAEMRKDNVGCALILTLAIGSEETLSTELRARAKYLSGNLEFLRGNYKDAVGYYNEALLLAPGVPESSKGDILGRDIAYNRAIALLRLQQHPEQKQDEQDQKNEKSDSSEKDDSQKDDQQKKESDSSETNQTPNGSASPSSSASTQPPPASSSSTSEPNGSAEPAEYGNEDRILDGFDDVPSYQEQEAKLKSKQPNARVMEDK